MAQIKLLYVNHASTNNFNLVFMPAKKTKNVCCCERVEIINLLCFIVQSILNVLPPKEGGMIIVQFNM